MYEAIESFLNQTFKNIELIVVADGFNGQYARQGSENTVIERARPRGTGGSVGLAIGLGLPGIVRASPDQTLPVTFSSKVNWSVESAAMEALGVTLGTLAAPD